MNASVLPSCKVILANPGALSPGAGRKSGMSAIKSATVSRSRSVSCFGSPVGDSGAPMRTRMRNGGLVSAVAASASIAARMTVSGDQSRRRPPLAVGTTGVPAFIAATMEPVLQFWSCRTGSAMARPAGKINTTWRSPSRRYAAIVSETPCRLPRSGSATRRAMP